MTTLANGMQVVLLEDHSTPIVHAEIWYHVGSKNEKPGRTGFAHLFEHMMFKGSKNVEPEGHPSWISSIGGQSNAYTTEDATVFWETVPAQYLPLVLWLEADRLASLRIDEDVFKTEREVVKEERRMRIENQPYGRLNEIIYDQAFTVHPYKHPTIGSMKDLEAASINDVRDFFRTYYVPNNATLVLVGDFDTKEALDLVTKYLGRVPKSERPGAARHSQGAAADQGTPRHGSRSPGRCRRSSSRTTSPSTATRIRIRCTSRRRCCPTGRARGSTASSSTRSRSRSPRSAAATSSRIPTCSTRSRSCSRATRRRRRSTRSSPSSIGSGTSRSRQAELQQAKNQFARDYIFSRESNKDKAMQLGHAVVIHNDIKTADGEFDIFMNITPADVQRVARKYFTPGEPAGDDDHAEGRHGRRGAALMRRSRGDGCRFALALAMARLRVRTGPGLADRAAAAAAAGAAVEFPPYQIRTLANGLQVIAVSHHEQPAVSLRLLVRAGGAQDPADKPGVAYLAASLLDQGTTTKNAEQIATTIDSIGGAHRRRRRQRHHLHQRGRDEGQPGRSRSISCPTSRAIRRSPPRKSSGSVSRSCRA